MRLNILLVIVLLFILSYTSFNFFALIASFYVPLREGYLGKQIAPDAPYLSWVWANFDGRHYIDIATKGYLHTNFAFFPLYPILISIAGYIFPAKHLYLAILLSQGFLLASMFMVYKIICLDYSKKVALWGLIAVAFLPLAFFYHAAYTDSLFLFLSTSCFYFARKKQWFVAGILAGFGFVDRFSAIALLPALVVEWHLQYGKRYKGLIPKAKSFVKTAFISIVLCLAGFGAYLVYLQVFHGNWLLFLQARSAWGEDGFIFPLQTVYRYLKIFFLVDMRLGEYWVAVLEFASIFAYLALAYRVAEKIRLSYGIFMIFLLLILPATGTFAGSPRYILHLFGSYIVFGLWLAKYKWARIFYFVLFSTLGFVLTAFFTRGYFIS